MKLYLTKIAAIVIAITCISGCRYNNCSQKMSTKNTVYERAEAPSPKNFADEEYVWESWWFGTNRVYKLDELDK